VALANQVVPALIDQQITLESRLLVVGGNARLEAAVGGLDVAVPVVDADDGRRVICHKSHRKTPFRRWCGNKKACCEVVSTSQQTCVFDISLRLVGVANFVHPTLTAFFLVPDFRYGKASVLFDHLLYP
jgi:ribosomal protein L21